MLLQTDMETLKFIPSYFIGPAILLAPEKIPEFFCFSH